MWRGWGFKRWPGFGPFSHLPPWERPGWIFGRGACWRWWKYYPRLLPRLRLPKLSLRDEISALEEYRKELEEEKASIEEELREVEKELEELRRRENK
ncbi:MAG: hypothetical protein PWQ22_175 [Archaeoglobaceae archaeon]|nr:hypothetical protein [Archaeoglobaceae archaeon]MDK2875765.1 hypothetical protein [Archaeoglobaceae archaeon]